MTIEPAYFKAPFIEQRQCWEFAEQFRRKYWASDKVPVDVLEIAEFDLELNIRTISRLKEDADVDALLLGDWQTLIVDQQQYLEDRFINRMRFSIAHEIGHYVLHREVFQQIPRQSVEDWIQFMSGMPDKEYGLLEFHANEFAGRLLVPFDELKREFDKSMEELNDNGIPSHKIADSHLAYLCIPLARHFMVSQEVIERRIWKEKLWPLMGN